MKGFYVPNWSAAQTMMMTWKAMLESLKNSNIMASMPISAKTTVISEAASMVIRLKGCCISTVRKNSLTKTNT